jgi:hypothetical protein
MRIKKSITSLIGVPWNNINTTGPSKKHQKNRVQQDRKDKKKEKVELSLFLTL